MPIGNHGEVMMRADYGDVTARAGGGGQSGVEFGRSDLPDDVPGKIYLLRNGIYPVRVHSTVDNQKVPIGQKLDRIRKGSRSHGCTRIISPQDISAQIGNGGAELPSGGADSD